MKKETFLAILNEESMIFTEKELMEMIDEELAKDPDEMDTDLIDLCLDALDGKFDDDEIRQMNQRNKRKRMKISKLLLIAAIIVIILGISIPVGAKYLDLNVAAGVIGVTGDHFSVDMHGSNSSENVVSKLESENLNPVIPNELLKGEYTFDNYRYYDDSCCKTYAFDFKNKDVSGTITICSYPDVFDFASGKNFADNEFEHFKQITQNGNEILVFGDDETSYIYYIIDNAEYDIILDCDYSTAYNIAETL